jgi:hypothetical protein
MLFDNVCAEDEWIGRAASEWEGLVGRGGVFAIEPLRSLSTFARYALKTGREKSTSSTPGSIYAS